MKKTNKKKLFFLTIATILLFSLTNCDIYLLLYPKLTIEIINNTDYNITKTTILQNETIIQTDIEIIEVNESRQFFVTERGIYTVIGQLSNATEFSEDVDFSIIEKKVIKVESNE